MSEEQASQSETDQPQRATDPASDDPTHKAAAVGEADDAKESQVAFPVVGVGASAGGLQAFKQLLQCLPADPGMAIIFVQHLSPHHDSNLDEIFARETSLNVQEVRRQVRLEPYHVYVIPPDQDLAVFDGSLQLMDRPQHPARHMPVDYLFRSLAEDVGRRAIGVILSGTGSDGVEGIKAIKAAGGITLAQDQQSAGFAGMPEAAAATGQVDLVLPPAMLAQELCRIARHPHLAKSIGELKQEGLSADSEVLAKIFLMLRRSKDVDFSQYKRSTVERRIARRMVLHKIDNIKRYLQFLQRNAAEVRSLFDDMLITVTSFFRDPESFATLKEKIFPQIVRGRDRRAPIRIWVPACSTGEEAYSLTIALLEYMAEHHLSLTIQIFATDVSDAAINKARQGHYPENIAGDLSEERLRRFFTKTDHGYQISKAVRDLCVFARQNVTKEPPFSHLDLLSCRNLLIYLGPALQRRMIPTFHYALRPNGFLMLGRSETIGGFSDLFSLVDREQKMYAKKATATRLPAGLEPSEVPPPSIASTEGAAAEAGPEAAGGFDLERQADALVLNEYGPPGIGELRLGIQRQDGLEAKIRGVFNSLNTLIEEVRAEDGRWYSLQVRPYRTAEDRITGAVVVLIDITEHRHTQSQRALAESIVQTVRQPMILLDADLRVIMANRAFYSTFAVTPGETEQHLLNRLGDGQWDSPQLRRLLIDVIPRNEHFQNFEIVHDFPGVGRKRVLLDASRVDNEDGQPHLILLCIPEVTDA